MVDFDDEWITSIYENCAVAMEGLQAKEGTQELSPEEQGLSNLCEVVVYLYNEVYEDPAHVKNDTVSSRRVLH
jgi:hypothetical protein